jgi:carbonic anhydrase
MKLRRNLVACCSVAFYALGSATSFAATAQAGHWSYSGPHGAAHWAELDPAYEACGKGQEQSPIDIRNARVEALPDLQFSYGKVSPSIVNNGHTVQVNVPEGQFLQVGDHRYQLVQFHFHTPSEERVEGKASAMVGHLVHRDAQGKLAVVAVLIQPGKANAAFESILSHLPARAGETLTVEGLQVDLAALLPASRRYYDFEGSLTTPPCSEGVHWMVLADPVTVSAKAVESFRKIYAANARPIQSLHKRVVRVSK